MLLCFALAVAALSPAEDAAAVTVPTGVAAVAAAVGVGVGADDDVNKDSKEDTEGGDS